MQAATRFAFSVTLLASAVICTYHSSTKLRRDGVLNLYPFPRVGRASHRTWQVPIDDLIDTQHVKRQLYAFPRVGRSEITQSDLQLSTLLEMLFGRRNTFIKRSPQAETDSPGMWFGPRLGRSLRTDDDDIPQNDTEKSEPEQLEVTQNDREKRNTMLS